MKSLNQELLSIIQHQATHLDTFVAGRAKRFNVKLSGRASHTEVSTSNDGIITIEVMARNSIRNRDAAFGRHYTKGVRQPHEFKAVKRRKGSKPLRKIKKRKKANIINRLMFAMVYNIQSLSAKGIQSFVISDFKSILKS